MGTVETPWRASGVSGVLFVSLSMVASVTNVQPPPYTAEAAVIATWFAEHSARYRVGHLVAGLAFLAFYVAFFAGFCERLRVAEGNTAPWARITWGGALLCPAAGTIAGSFIMGAALLGPRLSPEVAAFALAANFYAYVVSGALGGVAALGAAVAILRTRVFARWLGWSAAGIGLAALLGCAAIVENDPSGPLAALNSLAWLGFFSWIAAVSVAMIRARA